MDTQEHIILTIIKDLIDNLSDEWVYSNEFLSKEMELRHIFTSPSAEVNITNISINIYNPANIQKDDLDKFMQVAKAINKF